MSWHKIWLGPAPIDYYGGLVLSFLFHALRVDAGEGIDYGAWFAAVGWFLVLLGITVVIAEGTKKFRRI